MPRRTEAQFMSPEERRHATAVLLARGVLRCRRIAAKWQDPKSQKDSKNGLELSGETRLSVSDGTRELRLRDEGDNT